MSSSEQITAESMSIPYPWQQNAWERIQQQVAQDKVPHAILLSGQQGIGKWNFAQSLADYLLCVSPKSDLACGQCRSCQLLSANTHPDKKCFIPEATGKAIKIDQVRELSSYVANTSQQGGRKVILLGPVEQLNPNSANALLKSLEEPAGDTVLILFTHILSGVMATIRSRCQLVALTAPEKSDAISWLKQLHIDDAEALLDLAGGAPLIARDMVKGDYFDHLELFVKGLDTVTYKDDSSLPSISIAPTWLPISVHHLTQWWLQIIHQILLLQNNRVVDDRIGSDEPTMGEHIQAIIQRCAPMNKQWLFKFIDKLLRLRQQQLQGANPNMQLLCEELLLDWQVIVQRSR